MKDKLPNKDICFDDCGLSSKKDHFQYKYQLILEGESGPRQRLPWTMLGGFVIILQDTPQRQWYMENINPWEHYVPVKHDLSNLLEIIDWLRNNDDKAKEISQNGQKFAQHYFQKDHMINELKKTL